MYVLCSVTYILLPIENTLYDSRDVIRTGSKLATSKLNEANIFLYYFITDGDCIKTQLNRLLSLSMTVIAHGMAFGPSVRQALATTRCVSPALWKHESAQLPFALSVQQ